MFKRNLTIATSLLLLIFAFHSIANFDEEIYQQLKAVVGHQ